MFAKLARPELSHRDHLGMVGGEKKIGTNAALVTQCFVWHVPLRQKFKTYVANDVGVQSEQVAPFSCISVVCVCESYSIEGVSHGSQLPKGLDWQPRPVSCLTSQWEIL